MSVRQIGKKGTGLGLRWMVVLEGKDERGERKQTKIVKDPDSNLPILTKKRAQEIERDEITKRHKRLALNPTTATVAQYLEYWLTQTESSRAESTHYSWRSIVRKRIVPTLGPTPLTKLGTVHIETLYQQQADAGYAITSIQNVRTILSLAGKAAVRWRFLDTNPAAGAVMPRGVTKERPVWTAEETRTFLASCKDAPYGALWRLLIDSGMRIGEAQALTWKDLDCDDGLVHVRRTVSVRKGGDRDVRDGTKSDRGHRTIKLNDDTIGILRRHRAQQNARRLELGEYWHDRDLIFERGDGQLTHRTTLQDHLDRDCAAAGVRRLTCHELRHTSFTLAAAEGEPMHALAKRAGHRSTALMGELYAHHSQDADRRVSEALARVLGG